jgi:hypothetical protein
MVFSHESLVRRIEAAPHQSPVALVIVEKALIRKSSMIRIWLVEVVLVTAGGA